MTASYSVLKILSRLLAMYLSNSHKIKYIMMSTVLLTVFSFSSKLSNPMSLCMRAKKVTAAVVAVIIVAFYR